MARFAASPPQKRLKALRADDADAIGGEEGIRLLVSLSDDDGAFLALAQIASRRRNKEVVIPKPGQFRRAHAILVNPYNFANWRPERPIACRVSALYSARPIFNWPPPNFIRKP
jgi:hypothetical protein